MREKKLFADQTKDFHFNRFPRQTAVQYNKQVPQLKQHQVLFSFIKNTTQTSPIVTQPTIREQNISFHTLHIIINIGLLDHRIYSGNIQM